MVDSPSDGWTTITFTPFLRSCPGTCSGLVLDTGRRAAGGLGSGPRHLENCSSAPPGRRPAKEETYLRQLASRVGVERGCAATLRFSHPSHNRQRAGSWRRRAAGLASADRGRAAAARALVLALRRVCTNECAQPFTQHDSSAGGQPGAKSTAPRHKPQAEHSGESKRQTRVATDRARRTPRAAPQRPNERPNRLERARMRLPNGDDLMAAKWGRMRSTNSACSGPLVTDSADCTT